METSTAGDVVEIQLDLTPQDYVQFNFAHHFGRREQKARILVNSLLALLVLAFASAERWPAICFVVPLLLLGYLSVFLPAVCYTASKKGYATNKSLQQPLRFIVSAAGVSVDGPSLSEKEQWSLYWEARETKRAFYLYLANAMAQIIPKRCFTSEEQMQ